MVEVGDVRRGPATAPDLDCLSERIEETVAEGVADMGVIEAARARCLSGEIRQLPGGCVTSRRIVEAGTEADGALLHPLAQ